MKIDRNLYRSFKNKIEGDLTIKDMVKNQNFNEAESYIKDKILDKPKEFFTMEKLRKSIGVIGNLP